MRFQTNGDKPTFIAVQVRNARASSGAIATGAPVILALNGTNDGLAVVLPNEASVAGHSAFAYGIAVEPIAAGQLGECQVYGYNRNVTLFLSSRAASTDSWASRASIATGVGFALDTVNNCLSTVALTAALALGNASALAASIASAASSASATSDTRTAITTSAKVFLRML